MNAVIEQLRAEGKEVKDEDLAHIWPTRTEHRNVYGKYHFNLEEASNRQGLRPLRQSNPEAEVELECIAVGRQRSVSYKANDLPTPFGGLPNI